MKKKLIKIKYRCENEYLDMFRTAYVAADTIKVIRPIKATFRDRDERGEEIKVRLDQWLVLTGTMFGKGEDFSVSNYYFVIDQDEFQRLLKILGCED